MKIEKQYLVMVFMAMFLLVLSLPTISNAATTAVTYKPQTKAEMVAYLYGRISQLLEIQQALEKSGSNVVTAEILNYTSIETREADDILATSAVLRGEIGLYGNSTASVWFEYGEDEDFLDFKSKKVKISNVYDRAVRIPVTKLKDDQKYYYRMATVDKNGVVQYGDIDDFRTEELKAKK